MTGTRADLFSMLYDVGQIAGAILAGLFADRTGSPAALIIALLLAAAPAVWLTQWTPPSLLAPMLLLVGEPLTSLPALRLEAHPPPKTRSSASQPRRLQARSSVGPPT